MQLVKLFERNDMIYILSLIKERYSVWQNRISKLHNRSISFVELSETFVSVAESHNRGREIRKTRVKEGNVKVDDRKREIFL